MSHLLNTSRLFAWLFLTGLSLAVITVSGFYLYLRPGLPPVEQLLDVKLQTPLRIYSSDNRLIAEFGEKRRTPITIGEIPETQIKAFLAAEDARFYDHFGVDFIGLTRAAIELVSTGSIRSGGSTITMQVAKNYFLSRDRTFIRKFNEILLALQIERELDKNRILELYLNKIYLGNRAYGIAAAAKVYYNKPVDQLTLAQMAMLAGLPKAPSAYNPLANPQRALVRRNWILGRMKELGYITPEAYEEAVNAPLTASYNATENEVDADYVAEMARTEMVRRFGENAYTDGYIVRLTIDSEKQRAATRALRAGLEAYDRRHGYRGPAGRLGKGDLTDGDLATLLRDYPRVAALLPAVVTTVDDAQKQARVRVRDLGEAILPFETMTWARRYRTENLRGPAPKKPSDVVAPGDVIYVKLLPPADGKGPEPLPRVALSQVPAVEGALVSLNTFTGAIEALAGGYSFSQSKYNRATQAKRQLGSTFKPFLYLTALENGMTPATIYNDAPIIVDSTEPGASWRPKNSSGRFGGPTRLREALYRSKNLVSIRLLRDIGIQTTLNMLRQLKVPTDDMPRDLSLALGSGLLTPLELARAQAVIANGGYDVQPYLIEEITDAFGKVVYRAPETIRCDTDCDTVATGTAAPEITAPENGSQATETATGTAAPAPRIMRRLADARSVYILHSMMQDVIRRGTGRRAMALGRDDLAGKTGTTNEQKDTWFAGFNHRIATAVWVGFDQPAPLGRSEYGATAALPIWIDYMRTALKDMPPSFMPRPNGIANVRINPKTGQRARPGEEGIFELFKEEQIPPLPSEEDAAGSGNGSDEGLSRQLF